MGIADNQTGIYPIDSPGGWRIIGRTPIKLYDPASIDEAHKLLAEFEEDIKNPLLTVN